MKRLILAGLVAAGLLAAAAAHAHPELVQTTPAANATTAAPARIDLRFSERMVGAFSRADLLMVDMPGMKMDKPSKEAATAKIGADGMTLTLIPARPLSAGTYRVDYHVVSTDTHRITGSFSFQVK
ncbi:MAG: copper homeostasis periplasmic binding protein CopC [Bradyrhizobium sp.]|nr:copper homeostasis periplasmic binding protein CopC [Bradyrhizobium sp.]